MPRLVDATGPLLEQILAETYPLWGEGLTRQAYAQWNAAQMQTAWGRSHLSRVALVDADRVIASAKRYLLTMRIDGRAVPTLGIGAVFTPPDLRGRGFARTLIEALSDRAGAEGCEQVLLFSEIGPAFYERLGFVTVPLTTCDVAVEMKHGAPAMLVRAGEQVDAPHVAVMHAHRLARYRCGLELDADLVEFSIVKKRMLAGLDRRRRQAVEYFVSEEGHQAVAFVLLQVVRPERNDGLETWSVEACGDRDPSGARVGAMLQVLRARTPGGPPPVIRGWWPEGFAPPQLRVTRRAAPAVTMMMKPMGHGAPVRPPLGAPDVLYWHADAF